MKHNFDEIIKETARLAQVQPYLSLEDHKTLSDIIGMCNKASMMLGDVDGMLHNICCALDALKDKLDSYPQTQSPARREFHIGRKV